MEKKLLLIMNPYAGTRRANRYLTDLVALFTRCGYENIVYMTAGRGDGARIAQERCRDVDLVVCVGGDGTFNEVVTGVLAAGTRTPIGYIPAGSTNDFANSLKLSKSVLQAAEDIMRGRTESFDVGSFNGRCFSYIASFGAFTEASYSTPQAAKNLLGHLAYILEGMKDLPNIRPIHLSLEADGERAEGDYIFGAISNSTSIGGILSISEKLVDLHDGLFEVTLIKSPVTPMDLSRIVLSLQTRKYDPEVIRFFTARQVVLHCPADLHWTLDGEFEAGGPYVQINNLKDAVRLVTPSAGKEQ